LNLSRHTSLPRCATVLSWHGTSALPFFWSFISLEQEQGDHTRILAEIIQWDNLASRKFHDIISTKNVICFSASEEVKLLSVGEKGTCRSLLHDSVFGVSYQHSAKK